MAFPNKTKESSEKERNNNDGELFQALTSRKKDTETFCRIIKDVTARKQIFEGCHRGLARDHFGCDKTLAKITQQYFWPGITNDVKEWVRVSVLLFYTYKQKIVPFSGGVL